MGDLYSICRQSYFEFLLPVLKLGTRIAFKICTPNLEVGELFHAGYRHVVSWALERQPAIGFHRDMSFLESHLCCPGRRSILELSDLSHSRLSPVRHVLLNVDFARLHDLKFTGYGRIHVFLVPCQRTASTCGLRITLDDVRN